MSPEQLTHLIDKNFTTRQIATELNVAQTTVRYWLNVFKLKTKPLRLEPRTPRTVKICPKCNIEKCIEAFYVKKSGSCKGYSTGYCKDCSNRVTIEGQRRLKIQAVEYKGGCCIMCGYDKFYGALEFHHRNPTQKDFHLSKKNAHTLSQSIKDELDKCDLVCANCHREIHNELYLNKECDRQDSNLQSPH